MHKALSSTFAIVVSSAALVALAAIYSGDALADRSTTPRLDGGKSTTATTNTGSTCTVFGKNGETRCTRTFGITNHADAVAKCTKMKC